MPSIRDIGTLRQDVLFSTQIPGQGWRVLVFAPADLKLERPQERVVLLRTSYLMTDPFAAANPDEAPSFDMEAAQIVFRTTDPLGRPMVGSIVYVDKDWAYTLDHVGDTDNTQIVYKASRVARVKLASFGPTPPQLPLR